MLDAMLDGGISLGKITEFFGVPGIGKTQICMQLAVAAHIPESLGGQGGEVVYMDTEGSFMIDRLVDMATATVKHFQELGGPQGSSDDVLQLSVGDILSGIHYFRCHDHVELQATIHLLPSFLKDHSKVKLVIVDSIASPLRHSPDDPSLRSQLMASLAQTLNRLASQFQLAVVLTNQMTTRVKPSEGTSFLVPALGYSWGHACSVQVLLHWQEEERCALLYKATSTPSHACKYRIKLEGIRDTFTISEPVLSSGEHDANTSEPATSSLRENQELTTVAATPDDLSIGGKMSGANPPAKRQNVT
ncbi:DNA repair protein RAD51 homolog 3 [Aplysia californica]|uniref:DNA repair protein RAD51 homolog 3 n=1 Tax=Aplysia californica TaxID=6500 RepID=A0ABM0JS77_APLCA|nr:DNA repair protein RAD51 homolog 3 [Aplysia californica]